MKCALCKGKMERGKTNLPHEIGEEYLVVIKDVPALVCRQCGEPFIEISVLRVVGKTIETATRAGVTLGFIKYQEAA